MEIKGIFEKVPVEKIPARYPFLVFLVFGVLALGSFAVLKKFHVKLSFLDELEEDHPVAVRYREIAEKYGGTDFVFIALSGSNIKKVKECAKVWEEEVRQMPEIKSVRGRLPVEFFKKHAFYFFPIKDLEEFEGFVKRNSEEFLRVFENLNFPDFLSAWSDLLVKEILTREDIGDEKEFVRGVSALREWVEYLSKYLRGESEIDEDEYKRIFAKAFLFASARRDIAGVDEEYLVSPDLTTLLISAFPVKPSDDYKFNRIIYRKFMELKEKLSKLPECDGVQVFLGGNYIALEEQEIITLRDMRVSMIVGATAILLLYFTVFRGFLSLFYVGTYLLLGLLLVFGFLTSTIGYVTVISAMFGAFLMGLGVDYCVYLLSRFHERWRGENIGKTVEDVVKFEKAPIAFAALTTAFAFWTLLISQIKGVKILSFVSGWGVIIYFLTALFFAGALLRVFGRWIAKEKPREVTIFLSQVANTIERRPIVVVLPFLAIFVLSIFGMTKFGFEYNILKLFPDLEAIRAEDFVVEKFGRSKDYTIILAQDLDELYKKVEELEKLDTVGAVESIHLFYPKDISEKVPIVKSLRPILTRIAVGEIPTSGEVEVSKLRKAFERFLQVSKALLELSVLSGSFEGEDEAKKLGKEIEKVISFLSKVGDGKLNISELQITNAKVVREWAFDLKRASLSDGFSLDDIPEDIRKQFIGEDGSFIIFAYPKYYLWEDERIMKKNIQEVKQVDPKAFSNPIAFMTIADRVKRELAISIAVAYLFVLLLVAFEFRNPKYITIAMAPVTLALFFTMGITALFGMKVHYINMGAFATILGIGVDYGIHIAHRLSRGSSISETLEVTGRAILIAGLTTVAGFSSMLLAEFRGLRHYGTVLAVGVAFSLLNAVFLSPLIHKLIFQRKSA